MTLYDKDGNWTKEALDFSNEIEQSLKELMNKAINDGLSYPDFYYIVCDATATMILADSRHRRSN